MFFFGYEQIIFLYFLSTKCSLMKKTLALFKIFLSACLLIIITRSQAQQPVSIAGAVERQLNNIEKNIISVAEAMPEEKFYFTPETLSIKGSELKGVRTFAAQVKHLATDNFAIWSPVTGDALRADIKDVNGPENIQTKTQIIQYLKESFALGHKAIATLTEKNAMEMIPFRGTKLPRLDLVFYALTHDNDHYGQMIVYIRLAGIDPQKIVIK